MLVFQGFQRIDGIHVGTEFLFRIAFAEVKAVDAVVLRMFCFMRCPERFFFSRIQITSGLELLEVKPENNFINVGERCNVAGSRKFLRLINEKKYDEALSIEEPGYQIGD